MKEKLFKKIEKSYYLENYNRVIEIANQLLKIDPDSVDGHFFRGCCFNKVKRYPEAISDFSSILQHEPEHFKAKCYRSICFGKLHKIDRVIAKKIDENIKKYPEDLGLLNSKAMMDYSNGDFQEVLKYYSYAVQRFFEPKEHYYLYRGELYLELGEYDKAIDDFNEALKSNPNEFNHPYLFFNRAKAFIEKGEP